MIVGNWIAMREQWSPLETVDVDGVKTWDPSVVNAGMTSADLTIVGDGTDMTIYTGVTLDAGESMRWHLSQPGQWLQLSESGDVATIQISEYGDTYFGNPNPLTSTILRVVLRGAYLYGYRESDGEIVMLDLYREFSGSSFIPGDG